MKHNQSKRFEEKLLTFQKVSLPIITIKYIKRPIAVSRQRLRLYLEILEAGYPKCKNYDNETKAQFLSNVFKCRVTSEELDSLRSFKQITKKKVITMSNGHIKTITRTRWRNKYSRLKNYIHLQESQ